MLTTPIETKGWCTLTTCEDRGVPQDCIEFDGVVVCSPCLIRLSEGADPQELEELEEEITRLRDTIDKLEER